MRAQTLHGRLSSSGKALLEDCRAAVFVEYIVLVGVGVLVATALSAVGAAEVSTYSNTRAMLSTQNP